MSSIKLLLGSPSPTTTILSKIFNNSSSITTRSCQNNNQQHLKRIGTIRWLTTMMTPSTTIQNNYQNSLHISFLQPSYLSIPIAHHHQPLIPTTSASNPLPTIFSSSSTLTSTIIPSFQLDSVLRKRKKKMNKHKYEKRKHRIKIKSK
jgi:hypothetical protein